MKCRDGLDTTLKIAIKRKINNAGLFDLGNVQKLPVAKAFSFFVMVFIPKKASIEILYFRSGFFLNIKRQDKLILDKLLVIILNTTKAGSKST